MTLLTNDHPALLRQWHPIARVPETDAVAGGRLFGASYVVTTVDGEVFVGVDACPHRGARLSDGEIVDGCLRCPYHGWRFDSAGVCTSIPAIGASPVPARASLVVVPSRVALGLVWIRGDGLDEGSDDMFAPLSVPEWEAGLDPASGIGAAWLPDVVIDCSAGQFIDNFLDIAHFPVVHAGTFGADEAEEVADLHIDAVGERGLSVVHPHTVANREDPLVESGEHPLIQPRVMEFTMQVPFTARLRIELPLTGVENTIVVVASPTTATTTTLFTVLLRNDLGTPPDPALAQHAVDYELAVLTEDLAVIERLADAGLPLDLPAQVHTRADRVTVEYRRLLTKMVLPEVTG